MLTLERMNEKKRTRRDEIYDWICLYSDEHSGNSPSIREIAAQFSLHPSTIYGYVVKLQAERRLEYVDGKLVVLRSEWYPPEIY